MSLLEQVSTIMEETPINTTPTSACFAGREPQLWFLTSLTCLGLCHEGNMTKKVLEDFTQVSIGGIHTKSVLFRIVHLDSKEQTDASGVDF